MKKLLFILIISMFSVAAIAHTSVTDVIYLKNGTVVRGTIIGQIPNQSVKLFTSNSTIAEFKMDEIEKITTKKNGGGEFVQTTEGLPITRGNVIMGGSASFSFYNENPDEGSTYKRTSININPYLGYFIVDNLAVGAGVSYNWSKSGDNKGYSLTIGPEARYYFDMGLLLKAQVSYNLYRSSNDYKDGTIYIKPGVGFTFFMNPKVAIEPCISYELGFGKYSSDTFDGKYTTGALAFEIGFTIFL